MQLALLPRLCQLLSFNPARCSPSQRLLRKDGTRLFSRTVESSSAEPVLEGRRAVELSSERLEATAANRGSKEHVSSEISFAEGTKDKEGNSKEQRYSARQTCRSCRGVGFLPAGGFHRKNHVITSKIIGSKWTARQKTLGWTHFIVNEKRKTAKGSYGLMVATCDPKKQLWVNLQNLKDRAAWASSWLQKEQLAALDGPTDVVCQACDGAGVVQGFLQD